jgi:integrase
VSELVAEWLRDLARIRRAPRTIARAHAAHLTFLPWLEARVGASPTVKDLSRSVVEAWDREQVARGNSASTRRVSNWAVMAAWRWGWDHDDWRLGMAPPATPRMPSVERRLVVAATWEQMDGVLALASERKPEWVRRAVILLRGLGWRMAQILALEWPDVDLEAGRLRLRGELGKSSAERSGRVVPMAPWLTAELGRWIPRTGRLVGVVQMHADAASAHLSDLWRELGVPAEVWDRRPAHAFRAGLISELARARVDREAVEHYVGHAPVGVRAAYVDPMALALEEVAAAIPAPGVRGVSVSRRSGTGGP